MKMFIVFLLGFLPLLGFGQVVSYPAKFDRFMALTTGLGSQSIGFAANDSPVPTTAFTGSGAHVGNLGVFPDSGSKGLEVRGGASLPFGTKGVSVPVTAVGKVSAASLGKAFTALASLAGGWPGLIAAGSIPFIIDWMTSAGVTRQADGSWLGVTPGSYSGVAGCGNYPSGVAAANCAAMAQFGTPYGWGQSSCVFSYNAGSNTNVYDCSWPGHPTVTQTVTTNAEGANGPVSFQQVVDKLATVQPNPWVLSELYNKAVLDNKIDLNIVVAGPSGVAGPVSTVNMPATELTPASTTTTSTDYNCTYVMAVTSCNEVQTVTKDGVVKETTSKSAETPSPTPPDTASDTPLPGVPSLYTAKFPDGLLGVWTAKKAQMTASPLFSLVDKLMPSIAISGTCPQWNIPLDLGPWNYGSHDVAPPCWVWDFAKAIVILSALLLARSLIFGG